VLRESCTWDAFAILEADAKRLSANSAEYCSDVEAARTHHPGDEAGDKAVVFRLVDKP
jgi:hypothetical protein